MTSEGIERLGRSGDGVAMTTSRVHSVFTIDAGAAVLSGLALLLLAPWIRECAGAGLSIEALRVVGFGLLPWGVHNWLTGQGRPLDPRHVAIQLAGDSAWVVASLWICATDWNALSGPGRWLYVQQLIFVAGVLVAKAWALTGLRRTGASGTASAPGGVSSS
jgi:hypothetical protein